MKRCLPLLLALCLAFPLVACGNRKESTSELDLDQIAAALTASGCFPDSLETQDPGLAAGQLCLYEDRIEAAPEDLADARFSMALGVVADQFLLLEGTDGKAADRLEKALETYAQDQKSAYEFYNPEQAARLDDAVVERRGVYLLFAVGEDRETLADLCKRLMDGETVEPAPDASQPEASRPDTSQPEEPQEEPSPALSDGEKEAARQAALDYYAGTVFEVLDLTETDPGEGEIAFRVSCAKEGNPVDPDRTITLARREGVWTVVSEGY